MQIQQSHKYLEIWYVYILIFKIVLSPGWYVSVGRVSKSAQILKGPNKYMNKLALRMISIREKVKLEVICLIKALNTGFL